MVAFSCFVEGLSAKHNMIGMGFLTPTKILDILQDNFFKWLYLRFFNGSKNPPIYAYDIENAILQTYTF